MSTSPKKLTTAGVQIIPDAIHRDAMKKYVRQVMEAITSGGLEAAAKLPPPPPQFVPVMQDQSGKQYVLSDPPRDHLAIQDKLKVHDVALKALLDQRRELAASGEWSRDFFKELKRLTGERRDLLNQSKPAPRPVARAYKPPYDAKLTPDTSELGGFVKLTDMEKTPGPTGPGWAQQFTAALPKHSELTAKNNAWQGKTAKVVEKADLSMRRESDEWRQDHFTGVRDATNTRNPTYESGNATPRGDKFFAKRPGWTQNEKGAFDEYHQAHFAVERKHIGDELKASEALKVPIPDGLFLPPETPLAPDGTAEFLAQQHVFGDLRERMLIAAKSQDQAAFQAAMKQMLGEKLATLSDGESLLAALRNALDMMEKMS